MILGIVDSKYEAQMPLKVSNSCWLTKRFGFSPSSVGRMFDQRQTKNCNCELCFRNNSNGGGVICKVGNLLE